MQSQPFFNYQTVLEGCRQMLDINLSMRKLLAQLAYHYQPARMLCQDLGIAVEVTKTRVSSTANDLASLVECIDVLFAENVAYQYLDGVPKKAGLIYPQTLIENFPIFERTRSLAQLAIMRNAPTDVSSQGVITELLKRSNNEMLMASTLKDAIKNVDNAMASMSSAALPKLKSIDTSTVRTLFPAVLCQAISSGQLLRMDLAAWQFASSYNSKIASNDLAYPLSADDVSWSMSVVRYYVTQIREGVPLEIEPLLRSGLEEKLKSAAEFMSLPQVANLDASPKLLADEFNETMPGFKPRKMAVVGESAHLARALIGPVGEVKTFRMLGSASSALNVAKDLSQENPEIVLVQNKLTSPRFIAIIAGYLQNSSALILDATQGANLVINGSGARRADVLIVRGKTLQEAMQLFPGDELNTESIKAKFPRLKCLLILSRNKIKLALNFSGETQRLVEKLALGEGVDYSQWCLHFASALYLCQTDGLTPHSIKQAIRLANALSAFGQVSLGFDTWKTLSKSGFDVPKSAADLFSETKGKTAYFRLSIALQRTVEGLKVEYGDRSNRASAPVDVLMSATGLIEDNFNTPVARQLLGIAAFSSSVSDVIGDRRYAKLFELLHRANLAPIMPCMDESAVNLLNRAEQLPASRVGRLFSTSCISISELARYMRNDPKAMQLLQSWTSNPRVVSEWLKLPKLVPLLAAAGLQRVPELVKNHEICDARQMVKQAISATVKQDCVSNRAHEQFTSEELQDVGVLITYLNNVLRNHQAPLHCLVDQLIGAPGGERFVVKALRNDERLIPIAQQMIANEKLMSVLVASGFEIGRRLVTAAEEAVGLPVISKITDPYSADMYMDW